MKFQSLICPVELLNLQDSIVSIGDLKIYGSPYTPEFYNWAFMKKRGPEMRTVWDNVPRDVDILVTHGPPLMILDQNAQSRHQGCEDLLFKVKEVKPKIHVLGIFMKGTVPKNSLELSFTTPVY